MNKRITKEEIRQLALDKGLDFIGFANIERFTGAPPRMHPSSIFPECKTVIVMGKRVIRGGWRGIEEGTHFPNYTYFDYHGQLNSFFIHLPLYELACAIEDSGYEAVPYYPGPPEGQGNNPPIREGAVAPNVHLAIRIAGLAAGLGEIGWSKVFLTKKFGPRVRMAAILTDMEIEPDPLMKPGTLCDKCMECVKGCSAHAIPHLKDHKTIKINIEGQEYEWADVHMGRCTLSYHGGDPSMSPFIHKCFPGWNMDVTQQDMTEEAAYKFCWTLSLGEWRKTHEFPSGKIIEGHAYTYKWGEAGSFGIEGSRGCMRSCFNHLEKRKKIEQTFEGGEFIKRERWILPCKVERK